MVTDSASATPRLPPAPWQRVPTRSGAHRRDPLTVNAIVEAAVRVLDTQGLDGLSMRRVAEELDTGAASLYWHVGSKDGLLDLVLDHFIGELAVPEPDPHHWREQLKDVARTQRALILRHRDIVRISIGRIPMGPNALRYSERVLAILRAGAVPDLQAVLGYQLLIAVINGFTIDETGELGDLPADQPSPDQRGRLVRDYIAALPADQFPNLIALAEPFAIGDPEQRFEMLIDIFIDGLATRAAQPGHHLTEPPSSGGERTRASNG